MPSQLEETIEHMRSDNEIRDGWFLPVAEAEQGEIEAVRARAAKAGDGTAEERLAYCLDIARGAHQVRDQFLLENMHPDKWREDVLLMMNGTHVGTAGR